MAQVTIYHNPRCSKSRETLKLIEDKGIAPVIVDYLKTPPSAVELTRILALLGKGPRDILRKKEATEAGLDPAALSDAQLIDAMVANPAVIERPIVVAGDKAALGRPPESVLEIL
ncbi:MAG: arsenate reductase (glutaredoxin) [Rhodospirillaceae bacterium]|nr:arsenate reductase (glutaredoxin) [Rhodospirillales bacterium]